MDQITEILKKHAESCIASGRIGKTRFLLVDGDNPGETGLVLVGEGLRVYVPDAKSIHIGGDVSTVKHHRRKGTKCEHVTLS